MAVDFVKITEAFLDSPKIQKFIDQKTKKVFVRFGGTVRKTAQFSMRTRKGTAPAGQPPYAHDKKLLRKLLFFFYDVETKTVVIGPIRLDKTADQHIPKLMEEGGKIARVTRSGKTVVHEYDEHPFMKPAFDKHIGKLAEMYRNI